MNGLDEKRKTAANCKSEILDARVIANYGDPGLDEDYHFDILSRYVVVMLESVYRLVTKDRWFRMFAIVQRPKHLWIQSEGGISSSPTTQKRSDNLGNVNAGLAGSFSVKGIQRIQNPYALGELIKIRKLPTPNTVSTNPNFFQSEFKTFNSTTSLYNNWHTDGSTLSYINNDSTLTANLRQKTIAPVDNTNSGFYNFYLNKTQYEAFFLTVADSSVVNNSTAIFKGSWNQGTPVYTANGGYVFQPVTQTLPSLLLSSCEYEDINVGHKIRAGSNDCIPLIVAAPNTFPTPKQRQIGTISYNPSYSPISR